MVFATDVILKSHEKVLPKASKKPQYFNYIVKRLLRVQLSYHMGSILFINKIHIKFEINIHFLISFFRVSICYH